MVKSLVALTLMVLVLVSPASAQSNRIRQWQTTLTVLRASTASLDARSAEVAAVARQVSDWLSLNPAVAVVPVDLPPRPWTDSQLAEQIASLLHVVEQIAQQDPNQPFYLGDTTVSVTAPASTISPIVDTLDGVALQRVHAQTVAQAIEYLPGVSVDHKAPRNQTGISIGGFDSRQVPLYLDGIPAYVPFDGYVDLSRYLTSDVGEVQVAKGYSSPLLGPNVLGGLVNVVTRQPMRTVEGDASIGVAPGGQLETGVHAGMRRGPWFAQASADLLQSDFYRLSGSFPPTGVQRDDERVNSDQKDDRYRVRLGWTPRRRDQYVFSYGNQNGETGIPPYSGSAPACPTGNAAAATTACVTPKFWRWPYWDTDSYYFNSTTGVGGLSTLQMRAFYATYKNRMDMFDDAAYASMNLNASSGSTVNNDDSIGVSGTFETLVLPRHTVSGSFFVKSDTHREATTTLSRSNVATTTPEQEDRDRVSSYGVQDVVTIIAALRAHIGISADQLKGLEAQDLSSDRTGVVPFQVTGLCGTSGDLDSCTNVTWTYNPTAALTYATEHVGTVFGAFAQKSRFPTIKDRYSYKAGRAIPNPLLRPERATTWTAGYSRTIAARTVAQVDLFHSDVRDEIENIFFLSTQCAGGGRGGAGTCQQAVNVGSELHYGVNLTVRTTAIPALTVDASYSFLHREIRDASGAFPTGTPDHKIVATATARLAYGISAIVSARHLSGIAAMSDNGLPLPEATFTTVDAGATAPLRGGLSLQAGVKNLSDRDYYYWEGFPEAGRTGYVTLRFAF